MGIMAHENRGRRTSGNNTTVANKHRQNANSIPRADSSQSINVGALTKKPLVLHSTAAATMSRRQRSGPFVVEPDSESVVGNR